MVIIYLCSIIYIVEGSKPYLSQLPTNNKGCGSPHHHTRSQAIEFICRDFCSNERTQILSELKIKRIETAVLKAQLENMEE